MSGTISDDEKVKKLKCGIRHTLSSPDGRCQRDFQEFFSSETDLNSQVKKIEEKDTKIYFDLTFL